MEAYRFVGCWGSCTVQKTESEMAGRDVVSLKRRPRCSQQTYYLFAAVLILLEAEETPGPSSAGRIM
jgi:hypothetical protein